MPRVRLHPITASLAAVAVICIACSDATAASRSVLSGNFGLDSVDHQRPPVVGQQQGGLVSYIAALDLALDGRGGYTATERDSDAMNGVPYDMRIVTYAGVVVQASSTSSLVGPDSVLLLHFGTSAGRVLSANAFTQQSSRGVMFFSRR